MCKFGFNMSNKGECIKNSFLEVKLVNKSVKLLDKLKNILGKFQIKKTTLLGFVMIFVI